MSLAGACLLLLRQLSTNLLAQGNGFVQYSNVVSYVLGYLVIVSVTLLDVDVEQLTKITRKVVIHHSLSI